MIQKPTQKGFTIIEFLIYIGILSIFLIVVSQIFVSSLNLRLGEQSTSNLEQDGRFISARLIYDISRASTIDQPTSDGTSSNTLSLTIAGQSYSYSLQNSNLILSDASNSDQLNGYDTTVTNLNFLRLGNPGGDGDAVTFSFTLTGNYRTNLNTETRNFTSTVTLRKN